MTFRAYLDDIEAKTGLSPDEFAMIIDQNGLDKTDVDTVVSWLQAQYSIPSTHAHALARAISEGIIISDKQVGSAGSNRDEGKVDQSIGAES